MKCIDCKSLTLKPRSPSDMEARATQSAMAKMGFASCLKQPAHRFVSATIERKCGMFESAPEKQMPARRKWIAA